MDVLDGSVKSIGPIKSKQLLLTHLQSLDGIQQLQVDYNLCRSIVWNHGVYSIQMYCNKIFCSCRSALPLFHTAAPCKPHLAEHKHQRMRTTRENAPNV